MRRSREAEDPDRSFKLHMTEGGPRFVLSTQPPSSDVDGSVPILAEDPSPRIRPPHGRTSAASHMRPASRRSPRSSRAEGTSRGAAAETTRANGNARAAAVDPDASADPLPKELPQLIRPLDAPTQTHTVLDAYDNERLPTAFWKAALPPTSTAASQVGVAPAHGQATASPALPTVPQASAGTPSLAVSHPLQPVAVSVAADYTVEAGVERIHAPIAFPEQAPQILELADSEAAERTRRGGPSIFRRAWRVLRDTRVSAALPVGLIALSLLAIAALRGWPDGTAPQDVLVAQASQISEAAPSATPSVPQGSAVQQALGQGQYAVVARADDGTLTDRRNTDDLVGNDLETMQKLARIKSEALAQPLFIVAMRGGTLKVVERVNPDDRQAWREYTLAVWGLKQQSLSWPRENYLSRAALDPRRTLPVMSAFIRSHPDSRLVAAAFEDMRYVCYFTLQDPAKFRAITMQLLDEALRRPDALRIPEIVYVVKPYLKESVNQMLYERVHRFLGRQQAAAY